MSAREVSEQLPGSVREEIASLHTDISALEKTLSNLSGPLSNKVQEAAKAASSAAGSSASVLASLASLADSLSQQQQQLPLLLQTSPLGSVSAYRKDIVPSALPRSAYMRRLAPTDDRISGSRKLLTLGIPTLYRNTTGASYLVKCLQSLTDNLSPEDRGHVSFLIMLSDKEEDRANKVLAALKNKFQEHIRSGLFEIVRPRHEMYPEFKDVRHAFQDSKKRVTWRQRQCVDYGVLMAYAFERADYYLQLEDDVITTKGYVPAMMGFLKAQTAPWVMLEFSLVGFIGKMFADEALPRLSSLFWMFYEDQPVDFLLRYFVALSGLGDARVVRQPTLFEHIGVESSLEGKEQKLKDEFFADDSEQKVHHGRNPPAVVSTTIDTFGNFVPENAYSGAPGPFWGRAPREGDTFTIKFKTPSPLTKIVIETGNSKGAKRGENDHLRHGELQVETPSAPGQFNTIGRFEHGRIEVLVDVEDDISAVRILVTKAQTAWLYLREIAIW